MDKILNLYGYSRDHSSTQSFVTLLFHPSNRFHFLDLFFSTTPDRGYTDLLPKCSMRVFPPHTFLDHLVNICVYINPLLSNLCILYNAFPTQLCNLLYYLCTLLFHSSWSDIKFCTSSTFWFGFSCAFVTYLLKNQIVHFPSVQQSHRAGCSFNRSLANIDWFMIVHFGPAIMSDRAICVLIKFPKFRKFKKKPTNEVLYIQILILY